MSDHRLPLFPLRSVLCPGVALPLHIFEDHYRLMVGRCIERGEPFGVVLVRDGQEIGRPSGRITGIASVGTTAAIRRAGRYPDGRMDIVTVGEQRFRVEELDASAQPYLVGTVSYLDEPLGQEAEARRQAEAVGRRFLRYLELLQPAMAGDGPEVEIEFEMEVETSGEDDETGSAVSAHGPHEARTDPRLRPGSIEGVEPLAAEIDPSELSPDQRRELLMTAARRLTSTGDPTSLSYVLTALVQVDLATRQELLEAPDTLSRLLWLGRMLSRESRLLEQHLRPLITDASLLALRRN